MLSGLKWTSVSIGFSASSFVSSITSLASEVFALIFIWKSASPLKPRVVRDFNSSADDAKWACTPTSGSAEPIASVISCLAFSPLAGSILKLNGL